jgi:hypothetical protein
MAARQKILRVLITVANHETLYRLRAELRLDLLGGAPKELEGGALSVQALVPDDQVKRLKEYGAKVDVLDADAVATGRAKQKYFGKGNRFEGKDRVPRGLGRKIREGGREVS